MIKKNIAKIGITGSSGALGSHFIKKFQKKYKFKRYKKRIQSKKDISEWIKRNSDIEIFIHFAALSSINQTKKNIKLTNLINAQATINIIKLLNNLKLKKFKYFLFASTSHVYKPSHNGLSEKSKRAPISNYGKSKKIAEDFIIKNKNFFYYKVGIARIFNYYSKKHKDGFFIFDLIKKLKKNKNTIYINKVNTVRDYIQLDQLCDLIDFMIVNKINKPLNLGSGKKINLINLILDIKRKLKLKTIINFEKKKYPGFYSNNKNLIKSGYKKKLRKFIFK